MKLIIKKLMINLSQYGFAQRCLSNSVRYFQYLMGVGAGSSTENSGEEVLIKYLLMNGESGRMVSIVDVGANEGKFIALCRKYLREQPYKIHAFEPSNKAYSILHKKFEGEHNIIINKAALGEKSEKLTLYSDLPGSELASLYRRKLNHFDIEFNHSESVDVVSMDAYCLQHDIQQIDLLKIDAEGHELKVLFGCKGLFQNKKIRMISFEFGGCNIDSKTYFQDFYYFFTEFGYKNIYRITPSGYAFKIDRYEETLEQFRTTNYFVTQ